MSLMASFASLASIYEPLLTFWQPIRKCRLKGNLNGRMKTCVGPGGPPLWQFHTITILAVYM